MFLCLIKMKLILLPSLAAKAVYAFMGVSGNAGLKSLAKRDYGNSSGCPFTLSSSGSFSCPAGQLPDGQIRLNGTEDTVSFYLQPGGGFVDHKGYGCIVTGMSEASTLKAWHASSSLSVLFIDHPLTRFFRYSNHPNPA